MPSCAVATAVLLTILLPAGAWFQCRASVPEPASIIDSDGDGLSDIFEDQMLQRFAPRFLVSKADCAGLPAEFAPDVETPRAVAANGTIYGQVTKRRIGEESFVEIHYYHLWNRDCGQKGHALDAEHVSALVRGNPNEPAGTWKAAYWFAAAHQDTICDVGNGSNAASLKAEENGPEVWISAGKHAAFLNEELCRHGCGGDRCRDSRMMTYRQIINVGEKDALANGAVWVRSKQWPLSAKFDSDFTTVVLALLDANTAASAIPLDRSRRSAQTAIYTGNVTVGALAVSNSNTAAALSLTDARTNAALSASEKNTAAAINSGLNAVGDSVSATRRSLSLSFQKTGRFLNVRSH
jgi:hypothetical protein